jgi:hypothetical protein
VGAVGGGGRLNASTWGHLRVSPDLPSSLVVAPQCRQVARGQ